MLGVYLGNIFIICLSSTLLLGLFVLYIWPLKMSVDHENKLPWYYPCLCRSRKKAGLNGMSFVNYVFTKPNALTVAELEMIENRTLEKSNLALQRQNTVQIDNLQKKYGNKKVVDGLSLTMHRGEILVLLGHNGAGKTTTISMLTGIVSPTKGVATAFGKNLFGDPGELKDFIGICP